MNILYNHLKCNFPLTSYISPLGVVRSVGRSAKISKKGGKLHSNRINHMLNIGS